ncbi:MAG: hypothetical protein ACM3X6_05930 [Patescibacteria group bacterium]
MAVSGNPEETRRFVLDALNLSGAGYSEADDLVLASCRVTMPAGIFVGQQVRTENLQLVFTAAGAARHPSAELVCPGSYRLRWFLEGVRSRGFLTRQYYAEDLGARRLEKEIAALLPPRAPRFSLRGQQRSLVPFALAVFHIAMSAGEKREELLPLALNLADGSFRPGLPERLRRARFLPLPDYQRVERRRLAWRKVWRLLEARVREHVASFGTDWYRAAAADLSCEAEQLRQFYREKLAGAEDPRSIVGEYQRRMEEVLERFPTIRASLANFALLYLPVIHYAVELPGGGSAPPLRYEPAAGLVLWEMLDRPVPSPP